MLPRDKTADRCSARGRPARAASAVHVIIAVALILLFLLAWFLNSGVTIGALGAIVALGFAWLIVADVIRDVLTGRKPRAAPRAPGSKDPP